MKDGRSPQATIFRARYELSELFGTSADGLTIADAMIISGAIKSVVKALDRLSDTWDKIGASHETTAARYAEMIARDDVEDAEIAETVWHADVLDPRD
jgi:hypothetical protein